MTQIDRYIFVLFARTILICFLSLAGVFVVFHAFNHLDDLTKQVGPGESMAMALGAYYGPYMLMLFDWTAAIIALIAMLFTVGWLRRSGELTALLSAGVSHGRIMRPMIVLSILVVLLQLVNRECLIPPYRNLLTTKPGELAAESSSAMMPTYDKATGVLIEGDGVKSEARSIEEPSLRLYADYPGFGDIIAGDSAIWHEANETHPAGYLITNVSRPEGIDRIPTGYLPVAQSDKSSVRILYTASNTPWVNAGQCFFATTINPELLQDNPRSTRMIAMPELIDRVRNGAIHSSDALRVMLHERVVRPPLDICLIFLGLPLVVNRGDKRLFGMIAQAMGIVLFFFGLKTLAGGMGGSGYGVSPSMAAWLPLLILGPSAFARYCAIQTQ